MDSRKLKRYEKMLKEKRKEIVEKALAFKSENSDDRLGDFVDQSERNVNAMINIKIKETESKLLKAIDNALLRIEKKTYGICQDCGKPIAKVRLDTVPWTRLCVKCKEKQY